MDVLSIYYLTLLFSSPGSCDGCDTDFVLSHALRGDYNEIRGVVGDLPNLVWSNERLEPVVTEANEQLGQRLLK